MFSDVMAEGSARTFAVKRLPLNAQSHQPPPQQTHLKRFYQDFNQKF